MHISASVRNPFNRVLSSGSTHVNTYLYFTYGLEWIWVRIQINSCADFVLLLHSKARYDLKYICIREGRPVNILQITVNKGPPLHRNADYDSKISRGNPSDIAL
jgi:hypothetical protein